MALPDELRRRDGEIPLTGFLKAIGQGIAGIARGWRAPPRHEHDAEDAQAEKARAAVDRSIRNGLDRMEAKRDANG